MISRKSGQIVSVSSLLGKFAIKKRSVYASAKHALQGFMDALRAEVYEHNIKVNTVAPGYVETEVGIKALTGDGSEYGANDRGHDTKGMKADTAANIIIKAIAKNKREHYVIPLLSFSRFALYLARFAPGLAARIARNYNEDEK
jgi:short-subunit dehydrogenase